MADRPSRTPYSSNPIQSFTGFDSVLRVLATLQELEYGIFLTPALFADAMSRDDRIDAVIRTRIGAITGADLDVKAADDRRVCQKAAEMMGGTEDGPGRWDQCFPPGVLSEIFRFGYLLNFAVAEILWKSEDGVWWPRLKFWDTQFVRWDWQSMTYKLQIANGPEIDLPRFDESSMGDGKWFVWTPYGYQYAWRRGMLRSLAAKFLMRGWSYRDFARFCEVHGLCLVKAIVPGAGNGGNQPHEDLFLAQVAGRGNEPTILLPQGAEGNKYDIEYVEAMSLSWKSFGDFIDRLNVDIAVLMLGQNLTTEAAGGGLGGGEAKTHNLVRLDKAKEDALIGEAIRHQVLMPWARYNFGDPEIAPRPIYRVGPPEDENAKAATLKAVGDGILSLKAASDRVDVDVILEDFGIQQMTIEEAEAVKQLRIEQDARLAPKQLQSGGASGGQGGDGGPGAADGTGGAGASADDQKAGGQSAQISAMAAGAVAKRYEFQGLPIAVENPRGTTRKWTDAGGATGETPMLHDYGFIEGHVGNDGEELDCYIGPFEGAANVHIVHQKLAPDFVRYDEDKLMLGWNDPESARQAYLAHRNDDARAFGSMSVVPMDEFKRKLKRRTGTGKIRASSAAVDQTFTAIMSLADRAAEMRAGNGSRKKKKRDYPEVLTQRAVTLAARALAPDLAALKGDISKAKSFDELKDAIVARYRDKMDSTDLARLIQRTRLMSNLAGRLAITKGTGSK